MARGWTEGAGLGHQGPADGVVRVLHHPLVLEAPDVFGEAGTAALAGFFEVLLVVGVPHLPLRLGDPQVRLVRHLLLLRRVLGHLHLDGGLVDHLLGDTLASQRALLGIPLLLGAAAVAPSLLGTAGTWLASTLLLWALMILPRLGIVE